MSCWGVVGGEVHDRIFHFELGKNLTKLVKNFTTLFEIFHDIFQAKKNFTKFYNNVDFFYGCCSGRTRSCR